MVIESILPAAAKFLAKAVVGVGAVAPAGAVGFMRRVQGSVGLAPPTQAMLAEENPADNCALFRHLPHLTEKLAWRSLGAAPETPIHTCTLPSQEVGDYDGHKLSFQVKREDLISPSYGGNKVRTLQHQLATCEARRERGENAFRQLVSFGTGGSNQVVATVVHARRLGWDGSTGDDEGNANGSLPPPRINVCWGDKDEPDLDNTLNMLSALSFPSIGWKYNWGDSVGPKRFLRGILGAIKQRDFIPMMPGGNCPAGVLGQVGGVLELAEQIAAGKCKDPRRLYLPVGSACTISGLILGTVLVRHLGIGALSHPDFRIVGCNVHEGLAMLDDKVNFHTNPIFGFVPLTITRTLRTACSALRKLGGPDLEADALEFIKSNVSIRSSQEVIGIYGAHSAQTRAAAKVYDSTGTVKDSNGNKATPLWMCGHFVAKALVPLMHDMEEEKKALSATSAEQFSSKYMLWMTKSAVQPRGNSNEWEAMLQENDKIKRWADDGKAESTLRPGHVSTANGSADDYRGTMRKID